MKFATPMVAATVVLASGAAALSHELLWTRRMVDLIGATAPATARVLGFFFVGLALGAAISVPLGKRIQRPWFTAALLELGVGLFAIPILTLLVWTESIWPSMGPDRLTSWVGDAAKTLLALLLVVPPAALMGAFLPIVGRATLYGSRQLSGQGIWLYSINTLGGVVGLVLTVQVTLGALGISGAILATMAVNVLVAGICFVMDRVTTTAGHDEAEITQTKGGGETKAIPLMFVLVCVFTSGFCVLATEMLFVHLTMLVVPSAIQTNSAILCTVVLMLAIAAMLVPWLVARCGPPQRVLSVVLGIAAFATCLSPILFVQLTGGLDLIEASSFAAFTAKLVFYLVVAMGPCLFFGGLVFPLLKSWYSEIDPYGRHWGWLLAINGIGGIVGIEFSQNVLMPSLGVYPGLGVVALIYAGLALLFAIFVAEANSTAMRFVAVVAVSSVSFVMASKLNEQPYLEKGIKEKGHRISEVLLGREGVVVVTEHDDTGKGVVLPSAYYLGSEGAKSLEQREAHLPLLLHENPQHVAFIALGTSTSAGGAVLHDKVQSITVVEISSLVIEAAKGHFSKVNHGLFSDPRVTILNEDGRTYIAACRDRFDVVVGDMFHPGRSGVGRLHSREHFAAVKASLRRGGMFCQWLPVFMMTRQEVDVTMATFASVFTDTFLFRGSFSPEYDCVALVGYREGSIEWEGLNSRCRALRSKHEVSDSAMLHAAGIATMYLGHVSPSKFVDVPINSMGNPMIELTAAIVRQQENWREERLVRNEKWVEFQRDYADVGPFESVSIVSSLQKLGIVISEYCLAVRRGQADKIAELRWQLNALVPVEYRGDGLAEPEWLSELTRDTVRSLN